MNQVGRRLRLKTWAAGDAEPAIFLAPELDLSAEMLPGAQHFITVIVKTVPSMAALVGPLTARRLDKFDDTPLSNLPGIIYPPDVLVPNIG